MRCGPGFRRRVYSRGQSLPKVHMGDSSTYGYALASTSSPAPEQWPPLDFKEKWRFLEVETPSSLRHCSPELVERVGGLSPLGGIPPGLDYSNAIDLRMIADQRPRGVRRAVPDRAHCGDLPRCSSGATGFSAEFAIGFSAAFAARFSAACSYRIFGRI